MKLKLVHISFIHFFKGLLFFGALLLINSLSAQTISITSDSDAAEVLSGTPDTASFTISRPGGIILPSFIEYTIGPLSSATAADHDLVEGTVTLLNTPIGTPSAQTITIEIIDDDLVEGSENIIINFELISGPGIIPAGSAQQIINITDNDIGTFSIEVIDADATEENENRGQFRVVLDNENATGATISLPYTLAGQAQNGGVESDYNVTGQTVFTFPPGQMARSLNIIPIDDLLFEGDESVILTLSVPSNSILFAVAPSTDNTIIIEDNDCAAGTIAPVLNNSPTVLCDETGVNLNTYVNGTAPTGSELRWSLNANPTTAADLLTNAQAINAPAGIYFGVFWSPTGSCASPSVELEITINTPPNAGTAIPNIERCNEAGFGVPTSIDLDNALTGEDAGGTWQYISGGTGNPGINGNNVVNFNGDAEGTYIFRYTVAGVPPCVDATAEVTILVTGCDPCIAGDTAPVIDPTVDTIVCDAFAVSFNDYTNSIAPVNTVLTWSTDSDPENVNAHLTPAQAANPPTVGGTFYGFFYDAANSCASPTLRIDLVLNTTPTLSDVTSNERCGPGTVILTAMASDNATINWYESATGGVIIETGASFETPEIFTTTSYFVEATLNGCPTERQEAIATIVPQPSAGTLLNNGNASACSDASNGPTILDLDDLISGEDAGEWVYTSGPLADLTIPANNILDFEDSLDGDYIFTYTTTGAQAPCENESSTVTISVNDCDVDTDLDGLFDGPEAILGTDPNNPDTDGDGINDADEVGTDLDNPLDSDLDSEGMPAPDGIIDALDSNVLDEDNDGIVDQLDPANDNPCLPNRFNGSCDTDGDGISDLDEQTQGSDPDDPCDPNATPDCDRPIDLEILKIVDNENAIIGDEIAFTVTITNLDTMRKARGIVVGDLLENGFEYISNETSIGNYNEENGEWQIFEIDPLASHTLIITARIVEGDNYSNTAELLESLPIDDNPANDVAAVTLPIELPEGVNLILEKTVSLGVNTERLSAVTGLISGVEPEVEVIYYLKVINKSQEDVVSNIRVNDVFANDDNVEFEIINVEEPAETTFNTASGVWLINRSLAVDEEIEIAFRVAFRSEGVVINTAVIESSSPRESAIEDEDSTSAARVEITTRNEVEVGILYNQFSPNNDGLNDFLKINRIRKNVDGDDELVEIIYDIQIFNRYGNLIFETTSSTEEEVWDGSWEGKDSPDGTYFYTLNIDFGEGPTIQKGWIQLIR